MSACNTSLFFFTVSLLPPILLLFCFACFPLLNKDEFELTAVCPLSLVVYITFRTVFSIVTVVDMASPYFLQCFLCQALANAPSAAVTPKQTAVQVRPLPLIAWSI